MTNRERARVQMTDVVITFASLVTFVAVAPWLYTMIDQGADSMDPLSGTLLKIGLPLFVLGMIVSLGISAKQG